MSVTDNKNQNPEYRVEQLMNANKMKYMLNKNYIENQSAHKMFELGGGVPKLHSELLSHNNIDIESKLRGIKSVNLEGTNFNPDLKERKLTDTPLFNKGKVFVPPAFLHTNERSGFHNI
tara:strand:- start:224 stop:580 length:357 start_codon:yes stop_codon:yes gene_type:complete